jgi:hypothetical protein
MVHLMTSRYCFFDRVAPLPPGTINALTIIVVCVGLLPWLIDSLYVRGDFWKSDATHNVWWAFDLWSLLAAACTNTRGAKCRCALSREY